MDVPYELTDGPDTIEVGHPTQVRRARDDSNTLETEDGIRYKLILRPTLLKPDDYDATESEDEPGGGLNDGEKVISLEEKVPHYPPSPEEATERPKSPPTPNTKNDPEIPLPLVTELGSRS